MVESESVDMEEEGEDGREWRVGERGCFVEAAVEGLMSWVGEGWRFMDADCRVEAMSMAGLDILRVVKIVGLGGFVDGEDLTSVPRDIEEKERHVRIRETCQDIKNFGRLCNG